MKTKIVFNTGETFLKRQKNGSIKRAKKMDIKRCKNFISENELRVPNYYELAQSFNENSNWKDDRVVYIIIGTLTPYDGRENGYFYASQGGNAQIRIIDKAIPNCGIKKLYEDLQKDPKNDNIIESIKNKLSELGIAFLDVIYKAYSPNRPGMASDALIGDFLLDIKTFKKVFNSNRNFVYICNSKKAQEAFNYICSILGEVKPSKFCSQIDQRTTLEKKVEIFNQIYDENKIKH